MRKILLILSLFLIQNCSKPKTVLICGDHICVNKNEAEQYFEENLSIEVKILSEKKSKNVDLVQLNLKKNKNNKRKIYIKKKEKTNQKIKTLSKEKVKKIKNDLKKSGNKQNKLVKRVPINNNKNKRKNDIPDICTIVQKCNIDEISKFLIGEGQKKSFPDITTRE